MIRAFSISLSDLKKDVNKDKVAFLMTSHNDEYTAQYDGVYVNDFGEVVVCLYADESDEDSTLPLETLLNDIKYVTSMEELNEDDVEIVFECDLGFGDCDCAGYSNTTECTDFSYINVSDEETYIDWNNE